MNVEHLRELLAALPVEDEQLAQISLVVNRLEERLVAGAAALVQLQSARACVDAYFFKRGEPCPLCHRAGRHSDACYLHSGTGWNLLDEHENIVRENGELRAALARHLPTNGQMPLKGRMSLRDRARLHRPGE